MPKKVVWEQILPKDDNEAEVMEWFRRRLFEALRIPPEYLEDKRAGAGRSAASPSRRWTRRNCAPCNP